MPEKLYAMLLRLYPARFRREYGEEAMRIFRERLRDERSFGSRLQLWLELLADAAQSAPREHWRDNGRLAAAPVRMAGMFQVLESEPLRPRTFVFGTVFATVAVGLFALLLNHGGNPQVLAQSDVAAMQAEPVAARGVSGGATGNLGPRQGQAAGNSSAASQEATGGAQAGKRPGIAPQPVPVITEAEKQRVIAGVIANLQKHYRDTGTAQRIAEMMTAREAEGDYRSIRHGVDFADLLTAQMWTASQDRNLGVIYSLAALQSGVDEGHHGGEADIYYPINPHFGVVIPERRRSRK